jgi:hypothetical protein
MARCRYRRRVEGMATNPEKPPRPFQPRVIIPVISATSWANVVTRVLAASWHGYPEVITAEGNRHGNRF